MRILFVLSAALLGRPVRDPDATGNGDSLGVHPVHDLHQSRLLGALVSQALILGQGQRGRPAPDPHPGLNLDGQRADDCAQPVLLDVLAGDGHAALGLDDSHCAVPFGVVRCADKKNITGPGPGMQIVG